ncbi:MAG: hypothetical protein K0S33_3244 [Bacteroidetes bacterium]|jgi:hypothetical protein|nr:hypothetical protein [Bacteroidota bacterium]
MKKLIYTMAISLSSFGLFAQTSETRTVTDFTKINAEGVSEVIITQADQTTLKVRAESEDMNNILTEVKGNTLNITTKGNIKNDFKVYVTFKTLDAISTSGAAYVKSDSTFNAEKVELESSGASKIKLDVICKNIRSNATGASTILLTGATENHVAFVSGAASMKAYKLSTMNTDITNSGASTSRINVNQKLVANTSGASSLRYMGTPTDKVINVSASSDVKHVDTEENVRLNDQDTTRSKNSDYNRHYNWRNRYNFHWDSDFHNWAGVELNLNGLMGANGSTSLPASSDYMSINYGVKSMSWNLNLLQKNFHIWKNHINLVTGIGFGFNAYQFKNPIRLDADSSFTYYTNDSAISFDRNKLRTSYLQVPLMLEFNTSRHSDRSFHIGVGVIGGYKLGSSTIREYKIDGYEIEEKRRDDYNINPFKLDATVRIGYGEFTMFGTYGLTTLFETNKGPALNAFSVGVRIVPF